MGIRPHAKAKILIEQEVPAKDGKSPPKKIELAFDLVDEQEVQTVASDGTAQIFSRLADAVGTSSSGAPQKMVDDFALALDEARTQLKRTPLGDIQTLVLTGLRPPLEEQTARAVLNSLHGAQRGPLLPDKPVEPGATWDVTMALPAASGYSGKIVYKYKYARKGAGVAVVTSEGTIEGKGQGGQLMRGTSMGELRLELVSGRLLSMVNDSSVQLGAGGTAIRQHIRTEWQLESADGDGH
jgi:hypothetical protein